MESLWPNGFVPPEAPSAIEIVEEQAQRLSELTNSLVYAEVLEYTASKRLNIYDNLKNSFIFSFRIKSRFLDYYSFEAFSFSYGVPFYPVLLFNIDEGIRSELINLGHSEINNRAIEIPDHKSLTVVLKEIFHSEKINEVISSLMRVSNTG